MRPRHYTAENFDPPGRLSPVTVASMRPRHYTAENSHELRQSDVRGLAASMRPRHYTAENGLGRGRSVDDRGGFNEAAALHRGKRFAVGPRFAIPITGFNEAAALHRGKPELDLWEALPDSLLQ